MSGNTLGSCPFTEGSIPSAAIKKKMKLTKEETEFLKESNAIEREYSEKALEDAKHAWNFAKRHKHNEIDIIFIKLIHLELMIRLNPRIAGEIREVDVWVGNRKGLDPK